MSRCCCSPSASSFASPIAQAWPCPPARRRDAGGLHPPRGLGDRLALRPQHRRVDRHRSDGLAQQHRLCDSITQRPRGTRHAPRPPSLGILLVQDVAVVPLMLIVTALLHGGGVAAIVRELAISLAMAIVLVAVSYLFFNHLLPRLLASRTIHRNRDFPILLTMVLAIGSAWTAHRFGLSPALGAFVAGVLLAISPFATQIRADVQPLKTVLVTLFFAAVGMFADLGWVAEHFGLVSLLVVAILIGKAVLTTGLTWLIGLPWQFAIGTGLCLAQVGEFSFVLATVARGTPEAPGILSDTIFRAIVSATIATLIATPYLVAAAPHAAAWLRKLLGLGNVDVISAQTSQTGEGGEQLSTYHHPATIMLIGFGPAGQRVAGELLQAGERDIIVIDLNHENLHIAALYGLTTQFGDATRVEVLEHAGVSQMTTVCITLPSPPVNQQIIHLVRQLAPDATLYVRCRYHVQHWMLLAAGADVIVDEEEHVGERLAQRMLELRSNTPPSPPG
ncbi:MAG: cation:proton antiporter [Planctomycetaceae bacterium]